MPSFLLGPVESNTMADTFLTTKNCVRAAFCVAILTLYTMRFEDDSRVLVPKPMSRFTYRDNGHKPACFSAHPDEDISKQTSTGHRQKGQPENCGNEAANKSNGTEIEIQISRGQKHPKTTCVKQIQFWNPIDRPIKLKLQDGDYECPAENCRARFVDSANYTKVRTSHAVILHHRGTWEWEDLKRFRPEGQLWIYSSREPGRNLSKLLSPDPQHLFHNWTISFLSDSPFQVPYGRYKEDVAEVPLNDTRNWAMGKTRLIAWIASNCNRTLWERTNFVKNLTNLIQVDTYGACGTLDCPLGTQKCRDILSSYKFYLALENSECDDYITEKFWTKALKHNSVPIVYGTTRKDYEKVAPPNSFIHLSDFANMTSLVDYIKYLDKNDTAYNEYFNWKKRGSVETFTEDDVPSTKELCAIVRKLKEIDEMKKTAKGRPLQIVSKVEKWTNCHHLPSPWTSI